MQSSSQSAKDAHRHDVKTMVVQFSEIRHPVSHRPQCQNVLDSFMHLRRRVFAEGKGWRVWLVCKSDLDQYDQLDAYYVIAFDPATNEALAGARLLRTDRGGCNPDKSTMTYMIRDAGRSMLPGLPSNLCDDEIPCDPKVWELTRFASTGAAGLGSAVLKAVREFLDSQGAERFIFLSPPAVSRLAVPAGFTNVVHLGPLSGERGSRYRVFSADMPQPKNTEGMSLA